MHYSKAEDMLLAAWLCMPVCICRGMRRLYGESVGSHTPAGHLPSGIAATFVPMSPRSSFLSPAQPGARQSSCLQGSIRLVPTATHLTEHSADRAVPLVLHGSFSHEGLQHLKLLSICLAPSSPRRQSLLLGGDLLLVPSVRPTGEISESSSIFTPAQVHFPTPTCPLCL